MNTKMTLEDEGRKQGEKIQPVFLSFEFLFFTPISKKIVILWMHYRNIGVGMK